jgi:hypothetical protein
MRNTWQRASDDLLWRRLRQRQTFSLAQASKPARRERALGCRGGGTPQSRKQNAVALFQLHDGERCDHNASLIFFGCAELSAWKEKDGVSRARRKERARTKHLFTAVQDQCNCAGARCTGGRNDAKLHIAR